MEFDASQLRSPGKEVKISLDKYWPVDPNGKKISSGKLQAFLLTKGFQCDRHSLELAKKGQYKRGEVRTICLFLAIARALAGKEVTFEDLIVEESDKNTMD